MRELEGLLRKNDALSEELRGKKKALAELDGDRARLLEYKENYGRAKVDCDKFKAECSRLEGELEKAKRGASETGKKRLTELDRAKKSCEELESKLRQERESRVQTEEGLNQTVASLERKLRAATDALSESASERENVEKMYAERAAAHQAGKKKLHEALETLKQKEAESARTVEEGRNAARELAARNADLQRKCEAYVKESAYFKDCFQSEKAKVRLSVQRYSRVQRPPRDARLCRNRWSSWRSAMRCLRADMRESREIWRELKDWCRSRRR